MSLLTMLADEGGRKRQDALRHEPTSVGSSTGGADTARPVPSLSLDTGPVRHQYQQFDVEKAIRELSASADGDTVELLGALSNYVFEYMDVERAASRGLERMCGSSQELPNVFGEGGTREDCLQNTLLAHVNMLKVYRRLGTPFPKGTRKPAPRTRIITIRLSDEEYGWIKESASVHDKPLSNYVRESIVAQAMPAASTVRTQQSMERVVDDIQGALDSRVDPAGGNRLQ